MKLISPSGHDIHTLGTAIVFRQSRATPSHPDRGAAFWQYDFNANALVPIDQSSYHRIKFGPHFAHILQVCQREPPDVAHRPDGSVAVCDFAYLPIRLFDAAGALQSVITLDQTEWAGHSPYGIALAERHIWLAFPTEDALIGLSFAGRVEHRIMTTFSYPESLTLIGTTLYVCDMGHQGLYALDLRTLEPTVVAQFEEPLWEYQRAGNHHVVRLGSGIYHITLPIDARNSKPAG